MDISEEKKRLEYIGKNFSMELGMTGRLGKYFIEEIKKDLKDGNILEIGCADGYLAQNLSQYHLNITAIDGSKKLINKAKRRKLKDVKFIHTLFEEYKPNKQFDNIILSDVLEHVQNPVKLLEMSKTWIKDDGKVIIISPNATSLHRQIGVLAGMMQGVHDLNETDIKVGHRRVYDMKMLSKHIKQARLKITKKSGIFLKPLSDSQLNALEDNILDAFYLIGKRLKPDLLALLYFVCKKIN